MPNSIFFSWQADTPTREGRNLVERALQRAVSRISTDTSVEQAIRDLSVDRDTQNVPGSPPILETIFRKIDQSAVFVPDLTFVGNRLNGRPTPNPNVLIEYGWAVKSLGYGRMVPVMNAAFGEPTPEAMPFDMRHLRNPITYCCPADLEDAARTKIRDQLAKELEAAVRLVLDSEEFKNAPPKQPKPPPFIPKQPIDGNGRWKAANEPIGLQDSYRMQEVRLSSNPLCWFRIMPNIDQGRTWTIETLEKTLRSRALFPLGSWTGADFVRSEDGTGTYATIGKEREIAYGVLFAFTSGEMWTVDAYSLQSSVHENLSYVPQLDASFRGALIKYGALLEDIGVQPPFKWIAGMENLKGRVLYMPTQAGHMRVWPGPDGKCLVDVVSEFGLYTPGDKPGPTLKPFFTKLYNACATSRQDWQDA